MNTLNRNELLAATTVADPRWAAVLARDPAADGQFFISIRSTGVYCRPSCRSRPARPENVAFHASAADAERAGFRACKRCRPELVGRPAPHAVAIAGVCRYIEACAHTPTLAELAQHAGMSARQLHRAFSALTGVTPRAFAAACRARALRAQLQRADGGGSVTAAIYGAGYGSGSRVYEQSHALLGMTPTRFRARGAQETIRFAVADCPLGQVLVAQSARGVCAILLGDDAAALAHQLHERFCNAELIAGDAGFEQLVARVVALVEAPAAGLDLPLDLRGTVFQQRVWRALQAIPAGSTASYAEIAARIGAPTSVRAVAGACAANALAVAVPCHRVVRSDGALSGYRWGVQRKRALLEREAAR